MLLSKDSIEKKINNEESPILNGIDKLSSHFPIKTGCLRSFYRYNFQVFNLFSIV